MATLIDREEVKRLVADGAQLLEVLPAEEYAEDHLPGAVSRPLRLETLVFRQVYEYKAGKLDWMAAGLPTEGTNT
jgi:hypothetical protein